MKLHTKTKYGIMALLFLAAADAPVSIQEVSISQQISEGYLEAIFASLKKARLISSAKGRNGGYQLAAAPGNLSLYDILTALDQPMFYVPAQTEDALRLFLNQIVWAPASNTMIRYFQAVTLQDLQKEELDNFMYYI